MLDFPRWKVASIVALIAVLCALSIPSFLPERITNGWGAFPHPKVNFGLDLAGGSYLLLEADTQDLANSRLETMRDQVATEMRRQNPRIAIGDISTRGGQLSFMLRDASQVDAARERLLAITGGGAGMTGSPWKWQAKNQRSGLTSSSARIFPSPWAPPSASMCVMRSNISMGGSGRRPLSGVNSRPSPEAISCS